MSVSYVGMLATDAAATRCRAFRVRSVLLKVSVMKYLILSLTLLPPSLLSLPASAANCQDSISRAQAAVDAAINRQAGDGPWRPESLNALRSHQPTPQSIATAEGGSSAALRRALDALDRARAADSTGDARRCLAEVSKAQHLLASLPSTEGRRR